MASVYPGALDTLKTDVNGATDTLASVPHDALHNDANSAIVAVEATLGANPQGASATVAARLAAVDNSLGSKGDVNGPATSTVGHLATFTDTTGKVIGDGGAPSVSPTPATVAPADLAAAAAVGASAKFAREDHAHKRPTPAEIGAATAAQAIGVPVTTKTSAYTLVAADAGSIVEVNSASAVNVTIPASLFLAGQIVEVCQYGAGQVTLVAGSGVTLRNANGLKTAKQYSSVSIRFRSATEAVVSGDVAS